MKSGLFFSINLKYSQNQPAEQIILLLNKKQKVLSLFSLKVGWKQTQTRHTSFLINKILVLYIIITLEHTPDYVITS